MVWLQQELDIGVVAWEATRADVATGRDHLARKCLSDWVPEATGYGWSRMGSVWLSGEGRSQ